MVQRKRKTGRKRRRRPSPGPPSSHKAYREKCQRGIPHTGFSRWWQWCKLVLCQCPAPPMTANTQWPAAMDKTLSLSLTSVIALLKARKHEGLHGAQRRKKSMTYEICRIIAPCSSHCGAGFVILFRRRREMMETLVEFVISERCGGRESSPSLLPKKDFRPAQKRNERERDWK